MKKAFYLAKEPGSGVRSDLSDMSDKYDVTIVDCNCYGDWYRKKGYKVISIDHYFEQTMHFSATIGNPPYLKNFTNLAIKKILDEKALKKGAIIISETNTNYKYDKYLNQYISTQKKYGKTLITFFKFI